MHLKTRNVNTAFRALVSGVHSGTIPTYICASRAGEVMMVEEPVIVTFEKPRERVLFNQTRDANPFFHLYEALWMLAGRNDIASLSYYSSNYAKQVQDEDIPYANGAYGYRWRNTHIFYYSAHWRRVDQIQIIIDHLRAKPESRRAVLQMWDIKSDLMLIDDSKDVCCNLSVCFWIEQGKCPECKGSGLAKGYSLSRLVRGINEILEGNSICPRCLGKPHDQPQYLNMTVFNRSNDLIWGMLGSNMVCFSILQEYIATKLGLDVGVYNQVTNNLHVYTDRWEPEDWLSDSEPDSYVSMLDCREYPIVPLMNTDLFDKECSEFVERHSKDSRAVDYKESFLSGVAQPMSVAFHYYKRNELQTALKQTYNIQSGDWRTVAQQWLERRIVRRQHKVISDLGR